MILEPELSASSVEPYLYFGSISREQMIPDTVDLADELSESLAARNLAGDVTEDDQAHSVILHLLEKMPGLSGAEVDKLRRKTIDEDHEDIRSQAVSCT